MADKKISALTAATTPLAGTEVLPIVQSGSTVKVAVSDLTAGRTIAATGATLSGLTASAAVATDGSKNLVSVTNTGSGNNVLSGSPTVGGNWTLAGAYNVSQSNGWYITNGENQSGGTGYGVSLRLTSDGSGNYTSRIVNVAGGAAYNSLIFDGANVKIDTGNLVQGTAAKGVNFTANTPAAGMTSQLLNWYEEGTWTPVYEASGSNFASITMDVVYAKYTRIGRQVTVSGLVSTTSLGSVTGAIRITGLPFTVGNGNSYFAGGGLAYGDNFAITAGQSVSLLVQNNSTYMTLRVWSATTGNVAMTAAQWTATGAAAFSVTYFV